MLFQVRYPKARGCWCGLPAGNKRSDEGQERQNSGRAGHGHGSNCNEVPLPETTVLGSRAFLALTLINVSLYGCDVKPLIVVRNGWSLMRGDIVRNCDA